MGEESNGSKPEGIQAQTKTQLRPGCGVRAAVSDMVERETPPYPLSLFAWESLGYQLVGRLLELPEALRLLGQHDHSHPPHPWRRGGRIQVLLIFWSCSPPHLGGGAESQVPLPCLERKARIPERWPHPSVSELGTEATPQDTCHVHCSGGETGTGHLFLPHVCRRFSMAGGNPVVPDCVAGKGHVRAIPLGRERWLSELPLFL